MTMASNSQITITVLLANHVDQQHIYEFDLEIDSQADTVIDELFDKVAEPIWRKRPLVLEFPSITYAPQHVVGVKFEVIGPDYLQNAFQRAHQRAGFRPSTASA